MGVVARGGRGQGGESERLEGLDVWMEEFQRGRRVFTELDL